MKFQLKPSNIFGFSKDSKGQHEADKFPPVFPPVGSESSSFSSNVILKLQEIKGYFNEDDSMHFYFILEMQKALGMQGDILEIGSYFGRSTALLAYCMRESESLVVCDAFESETEDYYYNCPTVGDLKKSILTVNPQFDFSKLTIHSCYSHELSLPEIAMFRFAHIDGGHDADTAYRDICYAASRLKKNGIIAVDDYRHPKWPGVTEGAERFLSEYKNEFRVFADMNRHIANGRKLYLIKDSGS